MPGLSLLLCFLADNFTEKLASRGIPDFSVSLLMLGGHLSMAVS